MTLRNHVGAKGGAPLFRNRQVIENACVIAWRATRATMWARATLFDNENRHIASRVRARGYYVASGAARFGARHATTQEG